MNEPPKPKVLILASNQKTQSIVDSTLRKFDYKEIRAMDNGIEALKSLVDQPVGLVICDHKLKYISGWNFIKEVKTNDKIPNMPVLLMGEDASPANEDELKQYGLVKFLKSPPQEAELSFLINSTINLFKTSGTIENKYTKAKASLMANKADEAVELYAELHGLTKKSTRSSLGLAEAYVQKGDNEKAEKVLAEAAKDGDQNPAMTLAQIKILLQKNSWGDAEGRCDGLLQGAAKEVPYYYSRSLNLFLGHQRYPYCDQICRAAIAKDFKIPEFHITMARCAYEAGKHKECLDILDNTKGLFGSSSELLNMRGVCLRKTGLFKDAIQAYEEALSLTPMDAKVYFNLAMCGIAMKDFTAAAGWLQTCVSITPSFPKAREKLDEIMRSGVKAS